MFFFLLSSLTFFLTFSLQNVEIISNSKGEILLSIEILVLCSTNGKKSLEETNIEIKIFRKG